MRKRPCGREKTTNRRDSKQMINVHVFPRPHPLPPWPGSRPVELAYATAGGEPRAPSQYGTAVPFLAGSGPADLYWGRSSLDHRQVANKLWIQRSGRVVCLLPPPNGCNLSSTEGATSRAPRRPHRAHAPSSKTVLQQQMANSEATFWGKGQNKRIVS